ERKLVEEPRGAAVDGAVAAAEGVLGEGAGEEGLAGAGRAASGTGSGPGPTPVPWYRLASAKQSRACSTSSARARWAPSTSSAGAPTARSWRTKRAKEATEACSYRPICVQ